MNVDRVLCRVTFHLVDAEKAPLLKFQEDASRPQDFGGLSQDDKQKLIRIIYVYWSCARCSGTLQTHRLHLHLALPSGTRLVAHVNGEFL